MNGLLSLHLLIVAMFRAPVDLPMARPSDAPGRGGPSHRRPARDEPHTVRRSYDIVRISRSIAVSLAATFPAPGCGPPAEPPLVVATRWPRPALAELESMYHRTSGDTRPITWVTLAPGERLGGVVDRRGGVDLLLGGSPEEYVRLAGSGRLSPSPWRSVRRPGPAAGPEDPAVELADPRDDPAALARSRTALDDEGWARGYDRLVRRAARARLVSGRRSDAPVGAGEPAALAGGPRNAGRARRLLALLESPGAVPGAPSEDAADGLLADLLGAALIDAHQELRDADAALRRFGHPARAEAALGERPPWPPASVANLQASPADAPLLEVLAEQVAPDPESRAWLRESWAGPSRPVDGALLRELAGAVDGRLAREPRFRAWLRGEWTAWTRQLYRRVARVAGGYVPS